MTCYKCGEPVMGDNLQCDDCREANRRCTWCDEYLDNCECEREPYECPVCGGEDGDHNLRCPDNSSPYAQLIQNGYD